MRALYLIRHSLTEANEKHLYGGSTDIPLTQKGRDIAIQRRGCLPECDTYLSSGMKRADETLWLMTGRRPDVVMSGLREMDFGTFEMRSYEEMKDDPEYLAWIGDQTGEVRCPGGESTNLFHARVLAEGAKLLRMEVDSACVVCHGGAIVCMMQAWFPEVERHFYEWQPQACRGYRIAVEDGAPVGFEEV